MIHFLSLILSIIFFFSAGPVRTSGNGDCCGDEGHSAPCCRTESAEPSHQEKSAPDCCAEEGQDMKDCCLPENTESASQGDNLPDCCGQDSPDTPAEHASELRTDIPDCCGN